MIFERLGNNAENWQARLQKLAAGRLLGRFFAASRARLREVAERLGVHRLGTETRTQLVLQRSPFSGQLPPMPRAARKAPGGQ